MPQLPLFECLNGRHILLRIALLLCIGLLSSRYEFLILYLLSEIVTYEFSMNSKLKLNSILMQHNRDFDALSQGGNHSVMSMGSGNHLTLVGP